MRQPIKDLSSLPIWKDVKEISIRKDGHTLVVPRFEEAEVMDFHKEDVIYQELDGGVWTIVKRKGKYYRKLLRAL